MPEFTDVGKFGEESGVLDVDGRGGFDVGKRDNPGLKWLAKGSMYASIGSAMFGVTQGVEKIIGLVGEIQSMRFEVVEFEAEEEQVAVDKDRAKENLQKAKAAQEKKFELNLPVAAGSLQEACDLLAWEGMENPRDRDVYGRVLEVGKYYFGNFGEIQNLDFLEACEADGDTIRSLMNVVMIGVLSDENVELAELVQGSVEGKCEGEFYVRSEEEVNRVQRMRIECDWLSDGGYRDCVEGLSLADQHATCVTLDLSPSDVCGLLYTNSPKSNCLDVAVKEEEWIGYSGKEQIREVCKNNATEKLGITSRYQKVLDFLETNGSGKAWFDLPF